MRAEPDTTQQCEASSESLGVTHWDFHKLKGALDDSLPPITVIRYTTGASSVVFERSRGS